MDGEDTAPMANAEAVADATTEPSALDRYHAARDEVKFLKTRLGKAQDALHKAQSALERSSPAPPEMAHHARTARGSGRPGRGHPAGTSRYDRLVTLALLGLAAVLVCLGGLLGDWLDLFF